MKLLLSSNTDWYLYNYRLPLAAYLREKGWQVALMSPSGKYVEKIQDAGFRWIEWKLGRKTLAPWVEIAAIREAAAIYRAEKPDVVHHNTIKPSIYGSLAAQRAGVPAIVNSITGRGYVFLGGDLRARLLRGLVHRMYRYAFRPANVRAIFENSTDQRYFIEHELIEASRAVLIESSGVDPDVFSPQPEPDGVPVIVMAARMLWDKGVQELVEAGRRIGAPDRARIVLVGEPDEGNPNAIPRSQLEAWHASRLVEWWGFRSDMPAVLAACHIFTLPTKYAEGLPVSLLEASASGRPVVSTLIPGARDFVLDGQTGLLVPPGDVEALAAALDRLVQDPDLRGRMGREGRRRVEEHYTSERVNRRTTAIYEAILNT